MPDFRHEDKEFARGHDISVDAHPDDYGWNEWMVYPSYDLGESESGRCLYVCYEDESGKWFRGRRKYKPLSRQYAALFLEFARWSEEKAMSRKSLTSPKNEEAAKEWAETYGVLGLDPPSFTVMGNAKGAIKHALGIPGGVGRRTRNDGMGGPQETVEAFAREAWIANMALRLYEAASKPDGPDVSTLTFYMPDRNGDEGMGIPSTKDLHGAAPESARDWALRVVSEIVEDRVRGHVWPIPARDGTSAGHSRGWAFDSLLGAMWLQMSWLMFDNAKRCEWCGKLLNIELEWAMKLPKAPQSGRANLSVERLAKDAEDLKHQYPRKPRNDRSFCKNGGRCRAAWNYHHGTGKSSKAARKKRRESGGS